MAAIELGVVGRPRNLSSDCHIISGLPSMTRPQPIENSVSPTKASFLPGRSRRCGGGVARGLDYPPGERAHFYCVALANGFIDQRDALRFVARRDHPALVRFLQLRDAAGVVAMMVRHQDVGQAPPGPLERRFDRRRLGRIDRGGRAASGIVDEHAEIVGEAAEEVVVMGANVAAARNP